MSKERELLKKFRYASLLENDLRKELDELLAQPEVEPTTRHALDSYWNQEAYQRGYAEAELKLKRKPLSVEGIDELIIKAFYSGLFDFRIFARAIEKAHGITGGGNE